MLAVEYSEGVENAWSNIAEFIPKFVVFLIILLIGWIVAKLVAKAVNGLLERTSFDRAVERGGIKKALEKSQMDASDILAKVVKYFIYLITLQAAFGVFGQNPISDVLNDIVGYLPNIVVALIIIVLAGAIAAAVKELVGVALANLSYGSALANAASIAIVIVGVFAALDQLRIAEDIVTGLFYALLAIIVGTVIVAVGGSGVTALRPYWERALERADQATSEISTASQGATQRVKDQAQARLDEARPSTGGASVSPPRGDTTSTGS